MPNRIIFSEIEEQKIINDNIQGKISCKKIAKDLNISTPVIFNIFKKYNLKPYRSPLVFSLQEEAKIVKMYVDDKLSLKKIAALVNLSTASIKNVLVKYKIVRRNNIRSWCNENYFEKIDTEAKAYFLGLLLADGCISEDSDKTRNWQKRLQLDLQQKDGYMVEKLKIELEATKATKTPSTRTNVVLCITSNKLCEDLSKYGIVPRKTFTAKFPDLNLIPENLMNHFIRGLFDGDGCISKRGNYFSFDICGTLNVCLGVKNILSKIVVSSDSNRQPTLQGNIYRMYYHKMQSLTNLYDYLYKNATVFLTRKKDKFLTVSIRKSKKPKSYDIR